MSDGDNTVDEAWATARLRATLAVRGAELLTPAEHRNAWLSSILDQRRMVFRAALMSGSVLPEDSLQDALDTTAGVLLELPRLEQDAWWGWKDPRVRQVLGILEMAELPKDPPRVALAADWDSLRADVPFDLPAPRAGERPHTFEPFSAAIGAYLGRLEAKVEGIEFEPVTVRDASTADLAIPRHMLAGRLRRAVAHHVARVRRHVLPLARDHWSEAFAAQRSGSSLQRRRGDDERLEQGRALRRRSKLRYHLAAWILKQAGLARLDIGLFLHHIDASGLQTPLPDVDEGEWTAGLGKEIDNALAYWTTGAGTSGAPPSVQLGHIEDELRDLLRPVRG